MRLKTQTMSETPRQATVESSFLQRKNQQHLLLHMLDPTGHDNEIAQLQVQLGAQAVAEGAAADAEQRSLESPFTCCSLGCPAVAGQSCLLLAS